MVGLLCSVAHGGSVTLADQLELYKSLTRVRILAARWQRKDELERERGSSDRGKAGRARRALILATVPPQHSTCMALRLAPPLNSVTHGGKKIVVFDFNSR